MKSDQHIGELLEAIDNAMFDLVVHCHYHTAYHDYWQKTFNSFMDLSGKLGYYRNTSTIKLEKCK